MKLIKRLPKEEGSQFVCCWKYDGQVWSDTFRVVNGEYFTYSVNDDDFKHSIYVLPWKNEVLEILHFVVLK